MTCCVQINEEWLIAAQAEDAFRADVSTAPADNVKRGKFLRRRDGSYTNS